MTDPRIWLEDVEGADALEWVRKRNAETEAELFADPAFEPPAPAHPRGARGRRPHRRCRRATATHRSYNFWTDAAHRRGLLRRTTWERLPRRRRRLGDGPRRRRARRRRRASPGSSTVASPAAPTGAARSSTSRPAARTRRSPASSTSSTSASCRRTRAASSAPWPRAVSPGSTTTPCTSTTDLGPGTLTPSGYPRTVRRWRRGTPLDDAPSWSSRAMRGRRRRRRRGRHAARRPAPPLPAGARLLHGRDLDHPRRRAAGTGPVRLDVPIDVEVSAHGPWLTFSLRKDWTVGGRTHAGRFAPGRRPRRLPRRHGRPSPPSSRRRTHVPSPGTRWTRTRLVLNVLDDVRDRIEVVTTRRPAAPGPRSSGPACPTSGPSTSRAVDADELRRRAGWWATTS